MVISDEGAFGASRCDYLPYQSSDYRGAFDCTLYGRLNIPTLPWPFFQMLNFNYAKRQAPSQILLPQTPHTVPFPSMTTTKTTRRLIRLKAIESHDIFDGARSLSATIDAASLRLFVAPHVRDRFSPPSCSNHVYRFCRRRKRRRPLRTGSSEARMSHMYAYPTTS
mmetsp:Transcript_19023/g.41160  ORF Transcript_19023/g.41160 Transcript_19023/m.41160 type:complete len:166 (-) Transcript_19023:797-1294(-)